MRDEYKAADLLPLALQWLRDSYPGALLVPELCVGNWGAASLDVGAVTETDIIGIEIKGDGDSPARLDRQGLAYGMVATQMWLLPSPSLQGRCFARKPSGWGMMVVQGGATMPPTCGAVEGARTSEHQSVGAMLGVLWADELRALWRVSDMHKHSGRCPNSAQSIRSKIGEHLPLSVVRPFLCQTLRARDWAAKGRRVFRPGDPLPPISTSKEAAA